MPAFDFETLFPIVSIAGVLLAFVLIVLYSLRRSAREKREVAATAARLGMDFQDAGAVLRTRNGREELIKTHSGETGLERRELARVEESRLARLTFEILSGLGPWEVSGAYQNATVRIRPIEHGSGRNKKTFTRFEMRFDSSLALGLHISREGFLDRLGKSIFGARDITIARATGGGGMHDERERQFDDIARIKCKTEDEGVGERSREGQIRSLLQNPELQRVIVEILTHYPDCEIDDEGLRLDLKGTISDEKTYREVLDRFAACVRSFSGRASF